MSKAIGSTAETFILMVELTAKFSMGTFSTKDLHGAIRTLGESQVSYKEKIVCMPILLSDIWSYLF